MAGENFMDTQTGGEGDTLQLQPVTQETPQEYQVDVQPPVQTEPPVNEPAKSPIQVQTMMDAPTPLPVEQAPESVSIEQEPVEQVGFVDWFSGDSISTEIGKLEMNPPIVEEEENNPLEGIVFANEDVPEEDDYNPLEGISFANEESVDVAPVTPAPKKPVDLEVEKTKYPDLDIQYSDNGTMKVSKKPVAPVEVGDAMLPKVAAPVKMEVVKPKSEAVIDYKAIEDEILTYPSQPNNIYRIHEGAWQRQKKGSDYWHTITNEGSVKALNSQYKVNVPSKEVFTYKDKNNEYIIQDDQYFVREKGTYKWEPIQNTGRIDALNKELKQNVSISKAPQISPIAGNGLFPSQSFYLPKSVTKDASNSEINETLYKTMGNLKDAGMGIDMGVMPATNILTDGSVKIQGDGSSGLFSEAQMGKKLMPVSNAPSSEVENLQLARKDELSYARTEEQKKQVNDRYDRLIASEQDKSLGQQEFIKKNNEQYWKNVAEKKPDVVMPITPESFNKEVHEGNLSFINDEIKMKTLNQSLQIMYGEADRVYNDAQEFAVKDLDSWRGVYGQHLTDKQFDELKQSQKYLKTRLKENPSELGAVDVMLMKSITNDISEFYDNTIKVNNEINQAYLEGKSISEYQLDKKVKVASEIGEVFGKSAFMERNKKLFNISADANYFLIPYIKQGKIVEGTNGVYKIADNVSQEEKNFLNTKLSEMNKGYSEEKQIAYNTLQDDVAKMNLEKKKYSHLSSQISERLSKLDKGSPEYLELSRKLDLSNNKVKSLDDEILKINNGNRAFFLTEPKELAKSLTADVVNSSSKNIFSAIDKDLSPKQQFDIYYDGLWKETQKLAQTYGISSDLLTRAKEVGKSVFFDNLSAEEQKYFSNMRILESLTPLYLNNENGITESSASFFEAFMSGMSKLVLGDIGATHRNLQTDHVQTMVADLQKQGYTKEDLANPMNLEDLQDRQNVSWTSAEFAGQTMGTTVGIMAELAVSELINPLAILKVGSIATKLEKISDFSKGVQVIKNYETRLASSKYGKYLHEAIEQGARFEKAGLIFQSSSDELSFESGLLGSLGGNAVIGTFKKLAKLAPSKLLPTVQSVFGENTEQALAVFNKMGQVSKQSVGETSEEFTQELVSIYKNTLDSRGFFEELENRFGTLDQIQRFVISSMVMGGGMGFVQPKATMDIYNSLPQEAQTQVREAVAEVRKEQEVINAQTEAEIDQEIVVEEINSTIEDEKVQDEATKSEEAVVEEVVTEPIVEAETEQELDEIEALDALKISEEPISETDEEVITESVEMPQESEVVAKVERTGVPSATGRIVDTEVELTVEQKRKNKLLDMKTKYNQMTPAKRKTKAGNELLSQINSEASAQGYTLDNSKGRINILNDKGRSVGKTTVKESLPSATPEQINFAKRLINGGSLAWTGDPLSERIDLDISRADIRKGEQDILKGNVDSVPAKRLISALNEFQGATHIPYIAGSGGNINRTAYPIESNFKENDTDVYISPEDQAVIDSEQDKLSTEYDEWFNSLDEDSQLEIIEDYEGRTETKVAENEQQGEGTANVPNEKEATGKVEEVTFLAPVQKGQPARKMEKVDGVWMLNDNGELKPVSEKIQGEADVQFNSEEARRKEKLEPKKQLDSDTLQAIYDGLEALKMGKDKLYSIPIPPALFNAVIDLAKQFVKAGDSVNTAIRKASNQILNKAVEDGEIDVKQAMTAQEEIVKKTTPISRKQPVKKSIDETTGIETPRQIRDKKAEIVNKIRELGGDVKKGGVTVDKSTNDVRQMIKEYAEENLSLADLNTTETKGIMGRLVKAKTPNDLRDAFERIDGIAGKQSEVARQSTIKSIAEKLSEKNLTVKSGNKKKGKLNVEQFVALSRLSKALPDLQGLNQEQLSEIEETIDGIITEGKVNQKVIDQAESVRRKQDRAVMFKALAEKNGKKGVKLSNEAEIEAFFDSPGGKVVLIDGHSVTSKSQALDLINKNPQLDFGNSYGYDKSTIKNIAYSESNFKKAVKHLNPFQAAKNTTSLFQKVYYRSGEQLKSVIEDKFVKPISEGMHKRREGQMDKIQFVADKQSEIFGKENRANKILTDISDVQANKSIANEGGKITNDHMVEYYNISQLEGFEQRLHKSGVDVKAVREYVEANPKLKAWADFLMDYYNNNLKGEYEQTFIDVTNKPFTDGLYYPVTAMKQLETVVDTEKLFSGDTQGGENLINAVSGHLKERTGFKGEINTNSTARETLFNYIESMEHSKAFIPIAKDFNNLMRPEIQAELRKRLGEGVFRELLDSMQIVLTKQNPFTKKSVANKAVNGLMNWGVLGTLGWKLGSIPKQAVAFTNLVGAGLEDGINQLNWGAGFVPTSKQEWEVWNKLIKSNWVQERFLQGGIDMETRRIYKKMNDGIANKTLNFATTVSMAPITLGDAGSVVLGGFPLALAYYRKGIKKGMSPDEAYEWAYYNVQDKGERVLQSSREDITSLEQKTNIGRMLYTFKSAQTAMMTKTIDAGRKLTSGQNLTTDEKAQALRDIIYYPLANASFVALSSKAIMSAIMSALFSGEASDEDREEAINQLALETISSDLQGFGVVGLIADQAINYATGSEWKNNIPIERFLGSMTTAIPSIVFLSTGGEWNDLTDKEKNAFRQIFMAKNMNDAINDWKEVSKGEQDWQDAMMNWNEYDEKGGQTMWDRWIDGKKSSSNGGNSGGRGGNGGRGGSGRGGSGR